MNTQTVRVAVQPLVAWPREAEQGQTYLMTVDVRLAAGATWPYGKEEYQVYCMVTAGPTFRLRPLGTPAVVLHRYGSSYGPARFLLTALEPTDDSGLRLSLLNTWGVPILGVPLPMRIVPTSNRDRRETVVHDRTLRASTQDADQSDTGMSEDHLSEAEAPEAVWALEQEPDAANIGSAAENQPVRTEPRPMFLVGREELRTHLDNIRQALGDPRLEDVIERAAQQIPGSQEPRDKIATLLPPPLVGSRSSGGGTDGLPYLPRTPLASLVQSGIEEALRVEGVADPSERASLWSRIVNSVEHRLHIEPGSFTSEDPDWSVFIVMSALEHLARGNHPFNPQPAEHTIADDARLVIVGDWGTGLPRARDVATLMHEEIQDALAHHRQVHVIHLGNVYYSGLASEDTQRFLALWPVTPDEAAAGVTSWSLNGNRDMYSGGFGYFNTLLADSRFRAQRSPNGKPTSFFRLQSPSWDFVGLDTAWDSDVVSAGQSAVLEDPQAQYVTAVARNSARKLVLFSHHPLTSVYDRKDLGPTLPAKLAPVLSAGRVTTWWWGHEHRAIAYEESNGVRYPRCLGTGGVPILPDPEPPANSRPGINWHSIRTVHEHGQQWTRFGFAVLDLQPGRIDVRYRDDDGYITHTETIA